jgi:4,5-DOPA dioxygenase extradiol
MDAATGDPFHPAVPAGAYDDLLARVLPQARTHRTWVPDDGPLPALFVTHGAPPTLDDPRWLDALHTWSRAMPKPRAVVVVSAHWENAPLAISGAAAGTPLFYDFGGFDRRYYTLPYVTPDATALARRLAGTLGDTTQLHHHVDRGLDHGAFIPLMAMYPAADVPVVQLSMPSTDPAALLALGERLRSMRDEGILVIGSGAMTHSFTVFRRPELAGHTAAFDEWTIDAVARSDVDALIDYRRKAPGAHVSHATPEHFVPLLLTMGASTTTGRSTHFGVDGSWFGNSIRSLQMA